MDITLGDSVTAAHELLALDSLGSNPNLPAKRCSFCKETKSAQSFGKRGKGLQSVCKQCKSEYDKKWHKENRDSVRVRHKEYKKSNREWINSLKEGKSCNRCGTSPHPAALHYHHIDSTVKLFNIGGSYNKQSRTKILEEIEKCILICANCHAEETWG